MPHGEVLRTKVRLAAASLAAATDAFWNREDLAALFPEFLCTVHASVRATVPLLLAAEQCCRERAVDDVVAARLAGYYAHHATEERGHDEWLLADIESVGIDREAVRRRIAPPTIASLVGAQYYYMRHEHPVALLGFLAVLEGFPPSEPHLEEVRRRTGLPGTAFRMLIEHARLDPAHGDEVFEQVDALPLADGHAALLGLSALHTVDALVSVFHGLCGPGR